MKNLNVNQINSIKNPYIIDVRGAFEFEKNHIKGAINVELSEFAKEPAKYLKKDQENYIVCAAGGRSQMAVQIASEIGITNVTNLSGGMMGYFGNM